MIFRSPWPDIEPPQGSVCDSVLSAARQFGDKPAIIEGETGRTLTFRQLVHDTERVAAGLACAGLRPGEPLALVLPNCIEFVLSWYGNLLAGGWVVPIPPLFTPAEMEFQIRDSGAKFVITFPECAAVLKNTVENVFVVGSNWNDLVECDAPAPNIRSNPHYLAVLPYSSGTTGKPKGVMLTHANIVANMHQVLPLGIFGRDDVGIKHHAALSRCRTELSDCLFGQRRDSCVDAAVRFGNLLSFE